MKKEFSTIMSTADSYEQPCFQVSDFETEIGFAASSNSINTGVQKMSIVSGSWI